MITLILLVGVAMLGATIAYGYRMALRGWADRVCAASEARRAVSVARVAGWAVYAGEQARDAFFGAPERRWHGWKPLLGKVFRRKKGAAPVAVESVPPRRTLSLPQAFIRLGTLAVIATAGLANAGAESALMTLTFADYLGPMDRYAPWLSRVFEAPALLIAVSVLAGTVVWGALMMESLGFAEPTFDTPWVSLLSPAFLLLGGFILYKAGEVRGLAGLPTASDAQSYSLLRAAGNAKLTINMAVAVMAAGTSIIGLLAFTRLFAEMLGLLIAGAIATAACAGYAAALGRDAGVQLALFPVNLFLDTAGVPRTPPAPRSRPSSLSQP